MLHFETYAPGIKQNLRWMAGEVRPSAVLNPTKLLLTLKANGTRLGDHGPAPGMGPVVAKTAPPAWAANYRGPAPTSRDWHHVGGQEWRYDQHGVYTRDGRGNLSLWRTNGEPATCRDIFRLYGEQILSAATKHGVKPALIIMTIATETAEARAHRFTGPATFRWEAGVSNADVDPPFTGSYSAGPMQCLAATTRELLVKFGAAFGLAHQPRIVAPALNPEPIPPPAQHPLYDGATNIDIGTAEIRMRWAHTGDDPILLAAAFNAGGLYGKQGSSWGLKARGDHLDRAARWFGDACAVLAENGIL
jgi:hypothetical protein